MICTYVFSSLCGRISFFTDEETEAREARVHPLIYSSTRWVLSESPPRARDDSRRREYGSWQKRQTCLPWSLYSLYLLCLSARAVKIKYRRGNLNNRNLLSHTCGGWKSKIEALAGLVSPEALSPWLTDGRLRAVPSHGLSSVCVPPRGLCMSPLPLLVRTPLRLH